jgi:hypothetical protein
MRTLAIQEKGHFLYSRKVPLLLNKISKENMSTLDKSNQHNRMLSEGDSWTLIK